MLRRVFFGTVVLLAGCADDPPTTEPALTYVDWFPCELEENCRAFDDDGLRLWDTGRFSKLEAAGSRLEPDGDYCVWEPEGEQTYTLDNGVLTLLRDGAVETSSFAVNGAEATRDGYPWRRFDPPNDRGVCPPDTPRDPEIVYFEIVPAVVAPGETATLRWRVENAVAGLVFGPDGLGPPSFEGASGEETIGPLIEPQRYRLEVHGNLETLVRFAEVDVAYQTEVVVESTRFISAMAIAGDQIFWVEPGAYDAEPRYSDGALKRASLDGTGETTLATLTRPFAIAVADGVACARGEREHVFPENPFHVVSCVPVSGGTPVSIELPYPDGADRSSHVLAGGWLYTTARTMTSSRAVVRAPVDGSSPLETLAGSLRHNDDKVALGADRLLFTRTRRFSQAFVALSLADLTTTATLAATPDEIGGGIPSAGPVSDGTWVYSAAALRTADGNDYRGRILRMPLAGGEITPLVEDFGSRFIGLLADGDDLFFHTHDNHVGVVDTTTGEVRILFQSADANQRPSDLGVTATHVYWVVDDAVNNRGRIERATR